MLSRISSSEDSDPNISFHVNTEKSSSIAVYEYFSAKVSQTRSDQVTKSWMFYFGVSVLLAMVGAISVQLLIIFDVSFKSTTCMAD